MDIEEGKRLYWTLYLRDGLEQVSQGRESPWEKPKGILQL